MPSILNMPTRVLPDLVYNIAGHLDGDRSSLASCTLVSTSWLSPSRAHLWREISIDVESQFDGFVEFLQECRHLCQYIRELSLIGEDREDPDSNSEVSDLVEKTIIFFPTLCTILSALPRLRALTFEEIFLFDGLSESEPDQEHHYQLETLRLQHSTHQTFSFASIVEFFGLFSRIEHLHLDHVAWVPGTLDVAAIPHDLEIQSITVRPCLTLNCLSDIAQFLSGTQSMRTLSSLEIHNTPGDEVEVLVELVRSVGRNLVHLFLGISTARMGTGKLLCVEFASRRIHQH